MTAGVAIGAMPRGKPALDRDDWTIRILLILLAAFFLIALAIPLYLMLARSFLDPDGRFIGLANYALYFDTPALSESISNSFFVAGTSTVIVISLAFAYAYALTRTCMKYKSFFKIMAMVPLLSPSLLKAIALVYWFGNQGVLNSWLFGHSIYGPIGIIMGSVFWTFPHAVLIISTALAISDMRLYEAAEVLKTGRLRTFFSVTLPGARYGLISATIVVFILVFTDFGVPKVIGGNFNVLATDIYKEVIGQQNFEMGAVVSVVLLIPAVVAFLIDRVVTRKQTALLSVRAVPFAPKPNPWVDRAMLLFCLVITGLTLAILGMAQFAALVEFWPYNLELTLAHYSFELEGVGLRDFFNSLIMAGSAAVFGTALIFVGAFVVEKPRRESDRATTHSFHRAAPDGHTRYCPGACVPVLHQRAGQPDRLPVRDHCDSRDQLDHPFLHRVAPHCRDRTEANRSGVRGGVRVTEGTNYSQLPARHGTGMPACHLRHLHLPVP